MATQSAPKQIAIFPDCPVSQKLVNEDGEIVPEWQLFFQQLVQALQTNFGPEGIVTPQQTAANISTLQSQFAASANPSQYYGNLLYDITNNLLKVNIAGTFKTVTTS